MLGVVALDQVVQAIERKPFRLDLVDQAGQFAGKEHGLLGAGVRARALPPIGAAYFLGQAQLPGHAGHRRRQVACQPFTGQRAPGHRRLFCESHFLVVEIPKRPHPRQDQRPALACSQEGFAKRPAGAACRQEDGDTRQMQRVAAPAGQNLQRQGVEEGNAGSDVEDTAGRFCLLRRGHTRPGPCCPC